MGRVEHAVLQHMIQFEVRLGLGFVEVIARLADLLSIKRPIPRLQLEWLGMAGFGLAVDQLLHHSCFLTGVGCGCRRQLRQHAVDSFWRAGGFVFQHIGGVVRVTQQRGTLRAQFDDLGDRRDIIVAAAVRTGDRGGIDAFA